MQPDVTIPAPGSELAKKYDVVFGNESVNPFTPPRVLPMHVASVMQLTGVIQRRRRERQIVAEVGVWQAIMSRWFLTCMPHCVLHMIDPWKAAQPGETWYDNGDRFAKKPQEQFDIYHALAKQVEQQFAPRAVVDRRPSLAAASTYPDGFFDVVFIDAAHDKENVMADIAAWRPKVRPGGFLSGHDYKREGNYFGLIDGVNTAIREQGLGPIHVLPGKVWAVWIPNPSDPLAFDPYAKLQIQPDSAP